MTQTAKPKRWKRWMRWVLWFLLFQFILINISAALHAWKFTHFYTDPALRIVKPSSKNIFVKTWKLFSGMKMPRSLPPKTAPFPVDTVLLKTKDGTGIHCWYSVSDSAAKGTVILFHGYTTNKGTITQEASEFRFNGYNVMLVDLRGHGSSGGNTTTIGFREAEEVMLAYNYVKAKGENTMFLWGLSMGAIIIAKAIGEYDLKPAGAILEMPISSLQSFLEARSSVLGFPGEPFGFLVTGWIGIEQGFNGYRHQPVNHMKKINCPVLLQCGDSDPYVSRKETGQNFENIASSDKKLVIYENARHQSLLGYDPVLWRTEVNTFLERARLKNR